ncbi:DNA-binding protein [Methylobacterium sp. ID0610]|uniref:DNA-binding protein n=1 Tax=Methylobacterium carpenticola TaxID=3344827 RepID=UPI0036B67BAE
MHSIPERRSQPAACRKWPFAGTILAILAAAPAAAEGCRHRVPGQDRLEALTPEGDLLLASGRRARLDGVRWPEEPALAAAARAWLGARVGRPLATREEPAPDRWERVVLDAETAEGEPVDLAGGLVAAGLALVDAGESDRLCRPALLSVEAAARRERRGLWADRQPIPAEDAARLAALAGRFVVAEGRVRSVGERRSRTYLNFAPFGEEGLTVTVSKRTWRTLLERGLTAAALRGRRVRARGFVELWRGPTLDIGAAETIEMLDEERAQRR